MVRRCTYPSIHFFVSRSRSVIDCALCGVVWYVWCECGVCRVLCVCVEMVVCVVYVLRSVCGECGAAWNAEKPLVCLLKTSPCVPAKRPHVEHMGAFCRHTRRRLNLHTETFEHTHGEEGREAGWWWVEGGGFPSLSLLSCLPFSATMTMITRPVGLSLCTHGSNLPECQVWRTCGR